MPKQYSIADIKKAIKEDLEIVEKLLNLSLQNTSNLTRDVASSIFSSGGKRIRPIITILTAKLFNCHDKTIYDLAAAIELIHTSTLLHDDVIDGSALRRGKKTANNIHGNKAPILVGDYLFSKSFRYMVNTGSMKVLKILADASSLIAEGEVKQLELINKTSFQKSDYFEVINAKTAELFGAATESATVIAGEGDDSISALKQFGLNLGIAFQIIDDVLDYSAKDISFGKKLGDDFFEQKITLPIILLHEELHNKKELESLFNKENPEQKDLKYIILELEKADIFTKCFAVAKKYINGSLEILSKFPDSKEKNILEAICHIVISRSN